MILYDLVCTQDHRFEAWFRDGATFDRQQADGDIQCPICGDMDCRKAPMAPRIARAGRATRAAEARFQELEQKVSAAMEELRQHVESTCDYVGDGFAEEARKMHYGETEARGIYGETSETEREALKEEGIEVQHLPWPEKKQRRDA